MKQGEPVERRYSRSPLERYRRSIEERHSKGWKPAAILEWLEEAHDVHTSRYSIYRLLKKSRPDDEVDVPSVVKRQRKRRAVQAVKKKGATVKKKFSYDGSKPIQTRKHSHG